MFFSSPTLILKILTLPGITNQTAGQNIVNGDPSILGVTLMFIAENNSTSYDSNKHLKITELYSIEFLRREMTSDPSD